MIIGLLSKRIRRLQLKSKGIKGRRIGKMGWKERWRFWSSKRVIKVMKKGNRRRNSIVWLLRNWRKWNRVRNISTCFKGSRRFWRTGIRWSIKDWRRRSFWRIRIWTKVHAFWGHTGRRSRNLGMRETKMLVRIKGSKAKEVWVELILIWL